MNKNKRKIVVLLALCAVVTAFAAGGCDKQDEIFDDPSKDTEQGNVDVPSQKDMTELKIESMKESGEWVIVETTYGSFRYPFAFSDIVAVQAVQKENAAQLQFTARIEESNILIYTIHYNENAGIACGKWKISDTEEWPISVSFEDAPTEISADALTTFYAAQETFNNVIASMGEDARFAQAE